MSATEVIVKYYAAVNSGDWDAWLALFDENLVMDEQLMGHVEGIGPLRDAVAGLKTGFKKFLMHPKHVVVDGNEGMVAWTFEAELADGKQINHDGANYFRFADGKIVYMQNYHDTKPYGP